MSAAASSCGRSTITSWPQAMLTNCQARSSLNRAPNLLESRQRLLNAHRIDPRGVLRVDGEPSRRNGRDLVALAVLRGIGTHPSRLLGRLIVEQGLAVLGHEGVKIDERTDRR